MKTHNLLRLECKFTKQVHSCKHLSACVVFLVVPKDESAMVMLLHIHVYKRVLMVIHVISTFCDDF